MILGKGLPTEKDIGMTIQQFYEKKEQLRERLIADSKRLGNTTTTTTITTTTTTTTNTTIIGINEKTLHSIYTGIDEVKNEKTGLNERSLPFTQFKKRMIDLGYILADIPDSDLVVLDEDNSGSISDLEFIKFFKEGIAFTETSEDRPPPVPPVDDLLFKVDDNAGEVNVHVTTARELRKATTWFSNQGLASNDPNTNPDNIEAITKPRY